jgi:glycerol uptake facilitator-like aquaporin
MMDSRRKLTAELIGTFAIVFCPCAFAAWNHGREGLFAASAISGIIVIAMIAALGRFSGAHFNPAVSIGFLIQKRISAGDCGRYICVQIAGGCLAALCVRAVYGVSAGANIPVLSNGYSAPLIAEAVITFMLMLVILGSVDPAGDPAVPVGIAIGCAVFCGVLAAGNISGGSMNPARSFGPALLAGGAALNCVGIYIAGPISGAVAASLLYLKLNSARVAEEPK